MTRGVPTAGSRSKFEAKVRAALGAAWDYESEQLPYTLENRYWPDFTHKTTKVIIEAKGRFTGADRRKMLRVREAHPERDIRLCFMRDNKLNKKSATTYTAWATKNGFKSTVFPTLPITPKEVNAYARKQSAKKAAKR